MSSVKYVGWGNQIITDYVQAFPALQDLSHQPNATDFASDTATLVGDAAGSLQQIADLVSNSNLAGLAGDLSSSAALVGLGINAAQLSRDVGQMVSDQASGDNDQIIQNDLKQALDDVASMLTNGGTIAALAGDPLLGAGMIFAGDLLQIGADDYNLAPALLPLERLAAKEVSGISQLVGTQFQNALFAAGKDPLLVDLGAGIATGSSSSGIQFDLSNNGTEVETSWPTATTGILVLDNGEPITSGAQLFGDATSLPDGQEAQDGFQALAALDSNGDGHINASDPGFATLGIWTDTNQDGIVEPGEVQTLTQLGITDISLSETKTYNLTGGGSAEIEKATVTWADGHTSTIAEVGLNDNSFNSTFTTQIPVPVSLQSLPLLSGSGQVRDTQQAAALSPDFAQFLQQYAAAGTRAAQVAMLPTLLDKWAATSSFQSLVASNTFAANSDNFEYEFAGVQQYQSQSSSGSTVQTQNVGMADGLDGYTGPEWIVGAGETAQYQQWSDMVSVLEVFNGETLTSQTSFHGDNSSSPIQLAGNVRVVDLMFRPSEVAGYGDGGPSTGQIYLGGPAMVETGAGAEGSGPIEGTPDGFDPSWSTARLWNLSLNATQMASIQGSYVALEQSVYGSLVLQTRLSQYVDAITVSTDQSGNQIYDTSGLDSLITTKVAQDPVQGASDLIELAQFGSSQLNAAGYDWATKLSGVVAQLQSSGMWDSVVAGFDDALNPNSIVANADGSTTIVQIDGIPYGLLLGDRSVSMRLRHLGVYIQ